jgi:hypothetical protein
MPPRFEFFTKTVGQSKSDRILIFYESRCAKFEPG